MSTKESVLELIRTLPDDASLGDILTALTCRTESISASNPETGSSQVVDYTLDELSDEEWALFVAQGLSDGLSDPRDDLYQSDNERSDHVAR